MSKIDALMPIGGGSMRLSSGSASKKFQHTSGNGGTQKHVNNIGIRYTGETYSGGDDSYTAGISPKINLMELAYKNCEGSLYWLHAKQPIAWPYDLVCLGYSEEQDEQFLLTVQETKEAMEFLYTIYSNSDLAIATGMSRSRLSNYKRGVSRAPVELMDFVNKVKKVA